jgi:cysteine synthase A
MQGLAHYLDNQIAQQTLDCLRGPDGLVHCVFMCCDLPYIYLDEYSRILGPDYFAPLVNGVSESKSIGRPGCKDLTCELQI